MARKIKTRCRVVASDKTENIVVYDGYDILEAKRTVRYLRKTDRETGHEDYSYKLLKMVDKQWQPMYVSLNGKA